MEIYGLNMYRTMNTREELEKMDIKYLKFVVDNPDVEDEDVDLVKQILEERT